MNDEKDKVW